MAYDFLLDADKHRKEVFVEIFEMMAGNVAASCRAMGNNMSRKTVYRWCQDDPEFKTALEEVKEGLVDHTESKLLELINSGDVKAIMFYLKSKGRKRGYVDRQEIDHTMSEGVNIVINNSWDGNDDIQV